MKLSKNSGDFTPHPETDGMIKAVIVDITPLKKVDTEYGPKEKFRLVYETEMKKEDDKNCCVWSSGYTASLHEKASFRKDLKKILGRNLTAQEEDDFDTESLLHKPVQLIVVHEHDGDKTYANIAHICPDKSDDPMVPSGNYIRVQDRKEDGKSDGGKETGEKAGYRKAEQGSDAGRDDWQKTKVHVGKHAGVDLGDLDEEAVKSLIEKWLPKHKAAVKPTADDKRLAAALGEAEKLLAAPAAAPEEDY